MVTLDQLEEAQFIRVGIDDPDYDKFVQGDYPPGFQITPIKSMSHSKGLKRITFNIQKINEQSFGLKLKQFFKIYRLNMLMLTLMPLLSVHFFWQSEPQSSMLTVLTTYVALLLFHGSVFFMNDYFDHVSGNDWGTHNLGLMQSTEFSFRAKTLKKIGSIMFVTGCAFGLPILFNSGLEVFVVAVAGALCIFTYSMKRGLKSKGYGDFLIMLGMGPLLTVGFSLALWGEVSVDLFFSGLLFGFISVIYFQMKSLESLLKNSFIGNGTLISRLGFDTGKKLISIEIVLATVSLFVLLYVYGFKWIVLALVLGSVALVASIVIGLNRVNSPLSNDFVVLKKRF